jgi:hypothetical protein
MLGSKPLSSKWDLSSEMAYAAERDIRLQWPNNLVHLNKYTKVTNENNIQVFYKIDPEYSEREKGVILDAMRTLENVTCIKFKERQAQDFDFVHIFPGFI